MRAVSGCTSNTGTAGSIARIASTRCTLCGGPTGDRRMTSAAACQPDGSCRIDVNTMGRVTSPSVRFLKSPTTPTTSTVRVTGKPTPMC